MLDMFVAALMTVADPAVVAQAPAAPATAVSSNPSTTAGQSQNYAQVYSACQDVAGQIAVPAVGGAVKYDEGAPYSSRDFTPFHEGLLIPT